MCKLISYTQVYEWDSAFSAQFRYSNGQNFFNLTYF